jgi:hypothetical protein
MDIREETSGATRMQQQNKKPRLKTAATSQEGDDNQQHITG